MPVITPFFFTCEKNFCFIAIHKHTHRYTKFEIWCSEDCLVIIFFFSCYIFLLLLQFMSVTHCVTVNSRRRHWYWYTHIKLWSKPVTVKQAKSDIKREPTDPCRIFYFLFQVSSLYWYSPPTNLQSIHTEETIVQTYRQVSGIYSEGKILSSSSIFLRKENFEEGNTLLLL